MKTLTTIMSAVSLPKDSAELLILSGVYLALCAFGIAIQERIRERKKAGKQ